MYDAVNGLLPAAKNLKDGATTQAEHGNENLSFSRELKQPRRRTRYAEDACNLQQSSPTEKIQNGFAST